jgi:cytochrome c
MQIKLLVSIGSTAFAFYCLTASFSQQHNSPPEVTITAPAKNSKFQWSSIVPYAIRVSDQEDGNSEYNEITANEVLLTVAFLPDSTQAKSYLAERSRVNTESLLWMSTSSCFSCHAAKAKLIGPSFELIAKRYPDNSSSVEALTKKIITGSSGSWGDLKMPPHPDLKIEEVRERVTWILRNNSDPGLSYFAGMEGSFRTREKPAHEPGKGIYILTASYIDHGKGGTGRKQGQQSIVLHNY